MKVVLTRRGIRKGSRVLTPFTQAVPVLLVS